MTTNRNPLIFIFVTRLIDAIGFGIIMPVLPQLLLHLGEPDVSAAGRVAGRLMDGPCGPGRHPNAVTDGSPDRGP